MLYLNTYFIQIVGCIIKYTCATPIPSYIYIVQSTDNIPPPLPPKFVTLDDEMKSFLPPSVEIQPECGRRFCTTSPVSNLGLVLACIYYGYRS